MIDIDGLFNNLALLLLDQCIHTVNVVVFQGTDQTVFRDRREFSGTLMQQMNEIYSFIDFRNQIRATIEKLLRIDVRDYPEIAVRETLLNLLGHWDVFIITLTNINAKHEVSDSFAVKDRVITESVTETIEKSNGQENIILENIEAHGEITRSVVEDILEVRGSTAFWLIRKMMKKNLIKQEGKGKASNLANEEGGVAKQMSNQLFCDTPFFIEVP